MENLKIQNILKENDLNGFTKYLWKIKARYIVWITMNDNVTNEDIEKQFWEYQNFESLTFGGRVDSNTQKRYLDFWVAIEWIREASLLGRVFWQIAIWDNVEMQEIRL